MSYYKIMHGVALLQPCQQGLISTLLCFHACNKLVDDHECNL